MPGYMAMRKKIHRPKPKKATKHMRTRKPTKLKKGRKTRRYKR